MTTTTLSHKHWTDKGWHVNVHLAVHELGMAVVHQHMPPVTGQCRVGLDFRHTRASGSVLKRWVLLMRLMPRKRPLAQFLPDFGGVKLSPGPDGGSGGSPRPCELAMTAI
jgi:hypothetical protein